MSRGTYEDLTVPPLPHHRIVPVGNDQGLEPGIPPESDETEPLPGHVQGPGDDGNGSEEDGTD